MIQIIEALAMFFGEVIKTFILQWLVAKIKDWWASRKNSTDLQFN
jgi:hypothetical protein